MYGSRATGKAKKWSDYDVGVMGNERLVPKDRLVALRGDLEESSLPVLVDVVDFNKVNDDFKKVAMEKVVWWS